MQFPNRISRHNLPLAVLELDHDRVERAAGDDAAGALV
jgi:hypothetical protein